jgi:hypothetical protein
MNMETPLENVGMARNSEIFNRYEYLSLLGIQCNVEEYSTLFVSGNQRYWKIIFLVDRKICQ